MYTYVGEAVAVVLVDVVAPAFEPAPVVVAVLACRLANFVVVVKGTLVPATVLALAIASLLTRVPGLDPRTIFVLHTPVDQPLVWEIPTNFEIL